MHDNAVTPLNRLKPGEKALVVALAGGGSFQARLVDMGLNVGSRVEIIRSPNGRGGPALVAVGGTRLAIGRGMACKILVAVAPD